MHTWLILSRRPIAAILAKVILYLQSANASDPFFATWTATIAMQIIQFLELMAACILYVRPFLEALSSGFINGDDLRRRGEIRPAGSRAYGSRGYGSRGYGSRGYGLSVTSESHHRDAERPETNEEEANLTKRAALEQTNETEGL